RDVLTERADVDELDTVRREAERVLALQQRPFADSAGAAYCRLRHAHGGDSTRVAAQPLRRSGRSLPHFAPLIRRLTRRAAVDAAPASPRSARRPAPRAAARVGPRRRGAPRRDCLAPRGTP